MIQDTNSQRRSALNTAPIYLTPLLAVVVVGVGKANYGISIAIGALLIYMACVFYFARKSERRIELTTIAISLAALLCALCFAIYLKR